MREPLSYSVGIVNHGSFDDLEKCIESLSAQTRTPERVAVWDTGVDGDSIDDLEARYPEVEFLRGDNQGYAGGANRVVDALVMANAGAGELARGAPEFVLVLNPDVVLDADFAERLISPVAPFDRVAIATGKLLREDRVRIDSAGISFPRNGRPRDRGSEEFDRGQFDRAEYVEGASGAAMLLRVETLSDLVIDGELFDESFFTYHEDTDLCWRARRLGFDIRYEPAAVAIHRRGWQRDRRFAMPVVVRRHSFKNHYLQLIKNETVAGLLTNLPWLLTWEVLRLGFVLLRDRALLPAYGDAIRGSSGAWRKRRLIRERAGQSGSGGARGQERR